MSHPRSLAAIPSAPTIESILFDLLLSSASIYGGIWLGGAGVIFAENQAIRWLADVAGYPESAGGVTCFRTRRNPGHPVCSGRRPP